MFHAYFYVAEYEIGTPVVGSPCSYVVNFAQKRTGVIVSPTYPGMYTQFFTNNYNVKQT